MLSREQFAALPLAKRLIALRDPFCFMAYAVKTKDEVDAKSPLKWAPVWPDQPGYKPYIKPITRLWQNEPLVIVDKSRRMWLSYLMLVLHLHMAFTNTDRRIGIMSKKFEDSCAHLENMKLIYESIPEEIWPKDARPTMRIKEGLIAFDEIGSLIHGIASGPDQARQFGYSAIFWDEMDFCENVEPTYGALIPTISGGGRLTIATTHQFQASGEVSYYRRLLEDQV